MTSSARSDWTGTFHLPFSACGLATAKFSRAAIASNPLVRATYALAFFPELIPNFADEYADGVRPRLTVALLNGDIALVGVSGEFFSNHSIRLKERARVKQLFFFGYCNGYHQYFPTIEAGHAKKATHADGRPLVHLGGQCRAPLLHERVRGERLRVRRHGQLRMSAMR